MTRSVTQVDTSHRDVFVELVKTFDYTGAELARISGLTQAKISRFMSGNQDLTYGDFMHLLRRMPSKFQREYHKRYISDKDIEALALAKAKEILKDWQAQLEDKEKKLYAPNSGNDKLNSQGLGADMEREFISLLPLARRRLDAWIKAAAERMELDVDGLAEFIAPGDRAYLAALRNIRSSQNDLSKEVLRRLLPFLPAVEGWDNDVPKVNRNLFSGSVDGVLKMLDKQNSGMSKR